MKIKISSWIKLTWLSKTAQAVKVLASKTDDLSWIPGMHVVEEKNQFSQTVLCLVPVCWDMCTHKYINVKIVR